jgi:hypothetical protein
MGGLWDDADAANKASIAQITKAKGGDHVPKLQKKWQDMTDAEQKEYIEQRKWEKQSGKQSTSHVQQPTQWKSCGHDGERAAFTIFDGKIKVAGGANALVEDPPEDTILVIDLAGTIKFNTKPWVLATPPELAALKDTPRTPPPYLKVDWPDRRAPKCDLEWWHQLIKLIGENYKKGRVILSCLGAHGRTGTAMAAMCLAVSPKLGVADAIKFVRKVHCEKAVESQDQVDYLREFRPDEEDAWLDFNAASDKPYTNQQGGFGTQAGFTNVTKA